MNKNRHRNHIPIKYSCYQIPRSDSMSINNYIKDLLNIKDKNIVIDTEKIIVKKVKYVDTRFIYGKLTYTPDTCPCCGHVNESFNIIKYGTKTCKIKLINISNLPTILFLKKQRFLCKECGSTFSAKTEIVNKFSNISNDIKRKIALDLTNISSFKSIAESNGVSVNTVLRVFKEWSKSFKQDFSYLPPVLSIDEFKSTKSVSGAMSFICTNPITGEIVDILPDRRLFKLDTYFLRFPRRVRDQVKIVVCDIYSPYMELVKKFFKNACIVLDKFHIVQNFTRAFNMARVQLMKKFKTDSHEYRCLKRYWKLLLLPKTKLISTHFKSYPCFKKFMSQKEIVEHILDFDYPFRRIYDLIQNILFAIREKNFNTLKTILHEFKPDEFGEIYSKIKAAISTAIRHLEKIKNALTTNYNNGRIEGINNKIKVIKRVSYGYRSFDNFKLRILLCFFHKNLLTKVKLNLKLISGYFYYLSN